MYVLSFGSSYTFPVSEICDMCLQVLDKWYVLCTTLLTRLKQCHHPFISDLTLCDSALPNVYIHSLLCKGHLVWRYCHKVWTLCDVCHAWPFFSQLWDNLRGAARHRKTPGRPIQARVRVRELCDGGPQSNLRVSFLAFASRSWPQNWSMIVTENL